MSGHLAKSVFKFRDDKQKNAFSKILNFTTSWCMIFCKELLIFHDSRRESIRQAIKTQV